MAATPKILDDGFKKPAGLLKGLWLNPLSKQ